MEIATFSFPTLIRFGVGAMNASELAAQFAHLKITRPLLVTDRGLLVTSAFQKTRETLRSLNSLAENDAPVFSEVDPNPVEKNVDDAAQAFAEAGCDAILALGGGSALDVGKAVRLRIKRPEQKLRAFDSAQEWSGLAPFIAVPTTAGTGSEVGRSAVIILDGKKRVLFHPALLADLVLLDPELTRELPPKLTAATGADALTHCVESFTSPVFHPLCDGIALEGARMIFENLPRAVKNGADLEARGKMQIAAMMGGIAFQKDLGATHSLAHPLSAICGLHHGLANAICLPHVMEFNAEKKSDLYRRVGISLGLDTHRASDGETITAIRTLFAEIGLNKGLRAHGVNESHLEALAAQAFDDTCHRTNPVPVTREDLRMLYERAL